jgi:hypothetical protein
MVRSINLLWLNDGVITAILGSMFPPLERARRALGFNDLGRVQHAGKKTRVCAKAG